MPIPNKPRISETEILLYQQSNIDQKLNEAMMNSRSNAGRMTTIHVPISANLAIFDDNLIDDNVYYYEPSCLVVYLKHLLDRFMLYYYDNERSLMKLTY
jgi:hypothetical protein